MLALQAVEPVPGAPAQVRLRFLREPQEVVGVAPPQLFDLARLLEPLGRVLANRLQHREPRCFVRSFDADQPAVGQGREPVDDVEAVPAHAFRRLERAAACEHREPQEQVLVVRLEQLVAPLDGRADGALSLRCVGRAAFEQVQRPAEPLQQSRRRENADPRGGELDCQRQACEGRADLGNGSCVPCGDGELRPGRSGARHEQCDGLALEEALDVVGRVWRLER